MQNDHVVFIMGMPGSGKTTFAQALSNRLHAVPVINSDLVKCIAACHSDNPYLREVSHSAWKLEGPYSDEQVITGYRRFSEVLFAECYRVVQLMLNTYRVVIVEGMGVSPWCIEGLPESSSRIFLTNRNRDQAYHDKLTVRKSRENQWMQRQTTLTIIEQAMIDRCHELGDVVFGDIEHQDDLVSVMVDQIGQILGQ